MQGGIVVTAAMWLSRLDAQPGKAGTHGELCIP